MRTDQAIVLRTVQAALQRQGGQCVDVLVEGLKIEYFGIPQLNQVIPEQPHYRLKIRGVQKNGKEKKNQEAF